MWHMRALVGSNEGQILRFLQIGKQQGLHGGVCDHNSMKELRILDGACEESRSLCLCVEARAVAIWDEFLGYWSG